KLTNAINSFPIPMAFPHKTLLILYLVQLATTKAQVVYMV
ncbi:hypothetical protein PNI0360_00471, partial [Streptococcus pneumoniae PNI0360]